MMKSIEVFHSKTYQLNIHIHSQCKMYQVIKEAYEHAEDQPFLHSDEIFEWLAENTRHMVPFKVLCKYPSYRISCPRNTQFTKYVVTVTWQLGKEHKDWLFEEV